MVDPLPVARSLVIPAIKLLIADRKKRSERSLPLADLVNLKITDDFKRRKLNREVEAIVDTVAQRLHPMLQHEWSGVPDNERRAAAGAVIDAFQAADLSDDSFFSANGNPLELTRLVRLTAPAQPGLSEQASSLYERLLAESCLIYSQIATSLAPFAPRGIVELLERTSSIASQIDSILARLPRPTVYAPTGTDLDAGFDKAYRSHLSASLDELDLFGVGIHNFRPQTTLALAYTSLTVSTESEVKGRYSRQALGSPPPCALGAGSVPVESAIAEEHRTFLRGDAGSGKTTLLHWLALNAARGTFVGPLSQWNGRMPFLIKLRRFVGEEPPRPEQFLNGMADAISALMPVGWVHRHLASGRVALLVDGIDELPTDERRGAREWLRDILYAYPDITIIVTSRPSAVPPRWLSTEGFVSTTLERMGSAGTRELIRHWHDAVRDAGNMPCSTQELAGYERALLAQLDTSPHLQGLATTPLLCAMLCALNLDRRRVLPRDRMGIYAAAVDLLLQRRDAERRISLPPTLTLDLKDKLEVLQYLAWRLSYNSCAELPREEAVRRVAERIAILPMVAERNPNNILDHLIDRSGIIREPAIGRVDFVHRTFQEYLTARETAEQGDVGFLVDRAHLDSWRETIIMAAGHANRPVRNKLLADIIRRAEQEIARSRKLRLLAAACLETVGPLDQPVRDTIERCLGDLLPPRRRDEAVSLAAAGPVLLHHVPSTIGELSEKAACATVRTVARVGGSEALSLLSHYADDSRLAVLLEVQRAARYFDPQEYASEIFTRLLRIEDYSTNVNSEDELDAWRQIEELPPLDAVSLYDVHNLARVLANIRVRSLWLSGSISNITPIEASRDTLESLTIWSREPIVDLRPLGRMTRLQTLILGQAAKIADLDFLRSIPPLRQVWLSQLEQVKDFGPLVDLPELEELRLYQPVDLRAFDILHQLPGLLTFGFVGTPPVGLAEMAEAVPGIEKLDLFRASWLTALDGLASFSELRHLYLQTPTMRDVSSISSAPGLEIVDLSCPGITDLTPIANLPNLKAVYLRHGGLDVDLSPFADKEVSIWVSESQAYRRWRGRLGRSVKIGRF